MNTLLLAAVAAIGFTCAQLRQVEVRIVGPAPLPDFAKLVGACLVDAAPLGLQNAYDQIRRLPRLGMGGGKSNRPHFQIGWPPVPQSHRRQLHRPLPAKRRTFSGLSFEGNPNVARSIPLALMGTESAS